MSEHEAAPNPRALRLTGRTLLAATLFCLAGLLPWMRATLKVPGAPRVTADGNAFETIPGIVAWLAMFAVVAICALRLVHGGTRRTARVMLGCSIVALAGALWCAVQRAEPELPGALGGHGVHTWPTVGLFGAILAAILAIVSVARLGDAPPWRRDQQPGASAPEAAETNDDGASADELGEDAERLEVA